MNKFIKQQMKMIDDNISLMSHKMFYPTSEDDEETDEETDDVDIE